MSAEARPVAVVTGANRGIGYRLAEGLGRGGYRVVVHARTEERAAGAVAELSAKVEEGRFEPVAAELADPEAVARATEEILRRHPRIRVLVNNAGITNWDRRTTVEGFEETLAVNHFGYVRFTEPLLPALRAEAEAQGEARIVSLSSGLHAKALDLGILEDPARYGGRKAYAQTKLLNLLHAFDLDRRLEGTGISVNGVHPGLVSTGILPDFVPSGWFGAPFRWVASRLGMEPEVAAAKILPILIDPRFRRVHGRYFREGEEARPAPAALDVELQERARRFTLERIGVGWGSGIHPRTPSP